MPWIEESVMSQRLKLVEQMLLPGANVSMVCDTFGVSRKTAYKWLNRYKQDRFEGLQDASRAPHRQPKKSGIEVEKMIIETHKRYLHWGPQKLRNYLLNKNTNINLPSHTTIGQILKRNNCEVLKSHRSNPAKIRFERDTPNELWQMDFKGNFKTASGRCFPLTIIDDHSRFSVGLEACDDETYLTVKDNLITIFKEFGLPDQINVDNGNPWGTSAREGQTALEVWLIKLNITLTHSSPFHPQTNGKDERFHRTLKLELLNQNSFKSNHHAQKAFRNWQHVYNFIRPHDAIKGKPPSSRYVQSKRKYPVQLPEPTYKSDDIVKRCDRRNGLIRYKGKRYRIGKGFRGEFIALRETDKSDEFAIFFMDSFIKKLNLADCID